MWLVYGTQRTQRAVAGGTFDETLFGVSLNTHRTSFAEDLETAAGVITLRHVHEKGRLEIYHLCSLLTSGRTRI